jgi:ATP-binding cassette subfamily B protein
VSDVALSIARAGRPLSRLRRAGPYIRPFRGVIVGILLLTLAAAGIGAVEPLLLKQAFDALAGGAGFIAFAVPVGSLAALVLVKEAANAGSNWLGWRARLSIHERLLQSAVGKLQAMPLKQQREEGVGSLVSRLDRSIQGVLGAVTQTLFQALPTVTFLALSAGIMIALDWRLAMVALAFAPLPAILAAAAAPEQIRRERVLFESWSRIFSRFSEALSGLLTVRAFAMEEAERDRFMADFGRTNALVIEGVARDSGWSAASDIAIAAARIVALILGGWLASQHRISVGTVIAFVGYVAAMFGPVQGLTGLWSSLQKASVALDELYRILDIEDQVKDAPNAVSLERIEGSVAFEDVRFGYGAEPILEGVSFTAKPGERIAIVGPSGSGKTTLMSLLMRFNDPWSGAVRVDGRDLREVTQKSLRQRIGCVLQEPLLFNDTIRNNIAYGRPGASMEEIEAAARAANADAFIRRLPLGYDTPVGERGALLSGGERQRISIARALLKDPAIVILDEATSSLDAESEAAVQDAIERLLRGRTTFLIAHRLSTVTGADRILVLRGGRIDACGTHEALMREGGYYESLVRRQTVGLIANDE